MNKTLKLILIIVVIGLLLFFGYFFYVYSVFSFDDGKHYSKQDLVENYNARTKQIIEVKNYINAIVPTNKVIDIEFDDRNKVSIFHLIDNGIQQNSVEVDTLLQKLNWTKQTLKTIKAKLDAANCISVKSGEPCNIGFQRSGMAKYYYNLFEEPIAESLRSKYNDSCTYILLNDKVVLEYGGGAVGPQCFPMAKY